MTVMIEMGKTQSGTPALLDLEELLATRLLVQGNSGSGKSHLLRRLVEQSASQVQQVLIDPEGDFVTLAEQYGHVAIDAAEHTENGLVQVAGRVRQHRISVVLSLENLEMDRQMRAAAAFLNGLFDAAREFWYPVLVVVDEAQLFAPAAAGEVSDEARKFSLGAMTNLMCRGRKRGLAGVIATQRLAKLAKNVAAEASNFLMGRTFLDIDMARAADLLGMERRQAEAFRDLQRGQFIALGPALSRRPLPIRIGSVETSGRSSSPKLVPPPPSLEDARDLLMATDAPETPRVAVVRPSPTATDETLRSLAAALSAAAQAPAPVLAAVPSSVDGEEAEDDLLAACDVDAAEEDGTDRDEVAGTEAPALEASPVSVAPAVSLPADQTLPQIGTSAFYDAILRDLLLDPDAPYRSVQVLYQEFITRCKSYGVSGRGIDLNGFRRRLATARAGVDEALAQTPEWGEAEQVAAGLPEDLQALYLLLARAALAAEPCPSDAAIAKARGSRSARRARGLLSYLEQRDMIRIRDDVYGNRCILLTALNWETAPGNPEADLSAEAC
ncbi:helicase HerA domain-containing protein [Novispirillum itersonii]|uniref:AAA+ ATPase domain-containing protein n=1 Tax=Novispirillum itersonii TaxID=189 RepID=A0A7W9ZGB2_NOVIT|nr:ATP-binding protein [Novispirillum itersonii]MBB6210953.1 hypothetical protein [Novispirillum itersonii]